MTSIIAQAPGVARDLRSCRICFVDRQLMYQGMPACFVLSIFATRSNCPFRDPSSWLVMWLSCLVLFILPAPCGAKTLNIDASWQSNIMGQSNAENRRSLQQRYHVQWQPQITDAILFNSDITYNRNWLNTSGVNESLMPSATLTIQNDIFAAQIDGVVTKTRNSRGRDLTSPSWETTLSSNWRHRLWPSLQAILGENWSKDSDSPHTIDSGRNYGGFNVDWEFEPVKLYYNLYNEDRKDHVEHSDTKSTDHFVRADYSQTFWDERLHIGASQQFSQTTTKFYAKTQPGQAVTVIIRLSETLAGEDDSPSEGSLQSVPGLNDGDLRTTALTIRPDQVQNLGMRTNFQAINKIYLYTNPEDDLSSVDAAAVKWDVYTSPDGTSWKREAIDIPFVYDTIDKRFELDISELKDMYIKLVVTSWPSGRDINVTEMEALRSFIATGNKISDTQRFTQYLTSVNLGLDPTANTSLKYSCILENDDTTTGNDVNRLSQTGSFKWEINKYLTPTFSVSDTATANSDIPDTDSRSYAVTIVSAPLSSLDISLGITRNENYEDGQRLTTSHNVNFFTSAVLYPDLISNLEINYTNNRNEQGGETTNNYGARWVIIARLRSSLIVDLTNEYNMIRGKEDEDGGKSTININWRPSDLLSILANASQGFGNQSHQHVFLINTNVSVVRTRKTQVILGFNYNKSKETIRTYSVNWSWDISHYFTLQTNANYQETEEGQKWNILTYLSARF